MNNQTSYSAIRRARQKQLRTFARSTHWLALAKRAIGGLAHGCFVASLLVGASPALADAAAGNTLYQSKCEPCHGSPEGGRANAANKSSIITTAISAVGSMNKFKSSAVEGGSSGSDPLSATNRTDLALYLETVFDTNNLTRSTAFETPKTISVSADVAFGTSVTNLSMLTTGSDAVNHGVVSYNNSTLVITYTPSNGWVGDDTFSYVACNSNSTICTANRTITVTTNPPPVPVITSSLTKSGTVGINLTYNITASNGPTSFTATSLPPGLGKSGSVISGIPTTFDTSDTATLSATNEGGTGPNATLTFSIAKGNPNLTMATQISTQPFRPSTTFLVAGPPTTESPAAVTYTVVGTPAGACTISGTTITKVAVGSCVITAHQVASTNWTADDSPTKTVTISPAVQTLVFPVQTPDFYAFSAGATFPIDVVTSSGGSGNPVVYSSANTGVCTVSGTTVTMVAAGDCVLRANQAGTSNYSPASQATQLVVLSAGEPDSPVVTAAIGGDSRATVVFTAPPNPGSPITSYTATCSLGGSSPQMGTSNASPVVVVMPPGFNGAPWSCRVTATNAIGTSDPSNTVNVSPMTSGTPTVPVVRSANNVTFTIGTAKSFQVVATGTPNPTVFRSGTAPPASVPFTTVGQVAGTGLLSGTPALGTVGTYNMTFSAANGSGQANQAFVLTIAKASQTITFADPADRTYSPTPFAFAATASSGIAVTYTSSTMPVCTVTTAGVVTMVTVGTCTITASQIGDANYLPATAVPQSFQINQSTQFIGSGVGRNPWGTPSNRTFIANGMFALSPLAVASSGLPVSYASLTNPVCTISGTTITMVSTGTCTIEASQDGNANYLAAADQQRSFTINKANQTITFPAQSAQPYSDGGTFMVTAATGGASGNPVTYTSLSAGICTINGTLVTIVSVGVCTLAANQIGDNNYNPAAQVAATVAINAVAAGSPIATGAVGSDGKATITITPPGTDGGSPITGFTATCNPGNLTGSAASSPIVVTGLTNTVLHTCNVVTSNAIGNSAPSNAITVTPFLDTGANLWTAACSGCHGALPAGTRFNAAGTTSAVLQYVRANVPEMLAQSDVQALTANELAEIAKYIRQQIPAISVDTAYQTPKLIDIGFPVDLTLNTVSFTSVETVTQPTNGVLSAFTGTTVTYTPNAGFAGVDTFTYRGKRTSPSNLLGDPRTVTVTVLIPNAPVVTSLSTANGVFGQLFNYQITATNSPASFGANNLPPGVSVAPASGVISGSSTAAGVFNATITATNPGGTSTPAPLTITISAASQSITFNAQANQPFSPGGMFAINPTATATSGLTVTYSSLTTGVCNVNVTTVTMLTAGTCTIAANQAGNANINAALQITQGIAITATAPGAPNIGAATPGNLQATIAFTPPANNGGSPITAYNANCSGALGNNTVSPITVSGLTNGTLYTCSVTATSAAGTSVASGTVMVTPNSTPVAPAITSAAATTFTVLAPSTFTVTATGTPPPAITQTSGALPAGITFNSGVLSGTPASGTVGNYPLTMTATGTAPAANQSFTLTIAKANQTITFANPGARNFSITPFPITATSTSGISVVFTSNTTSVCSVVGTSVTMLTTGVCSISADVASTADYNAANTVTQGFSIAPASQTITFGAQTTPRNFSTTPFAITPLATASSGLAVIYSSTTPGVCSVSGVSVSMITAGTCTIAANQGGNANFSAANQSTQSITITAVAPGAPTIGIGTGSDMQVNVGFTPPLSNGGNPISQYNASCTPSGTGSGSTSPVAVTGLTNGTTYTCSVTATNTAALTSLPSGTVTVTPTSANGAALWLSVCDVCHTQVPAGNQLNGAGSTATVLNYVRATQSLMMNNTAVQALTQAELAALAAYIGNVVPVNEVTTAFNTAVPIDVSSHITLNTISFSSVEVVTAPTNGTLSAFTGTSVTYTPNPGFTGVDTFTYRGKHTSPALTGDPRTVTVTVVGQMPVISSTLTLNGTFGQTVNYQIAASGTPTSFGATDLPASLNVNTGNGAITGIASAVGNFNSTISATNGNGTGNATLNIIIAKAPQIITFSTQTGPRAFSVGGSFAISPLATGGASGNSLAYSSTTPGVCTLSGTTVNIVSAGICTLAANQDGNANYDNATQVTQNITITPIAPAAPALDDAVAGNAQATINFTPPASTGGSAITNYTATCGAISVNGATSPITVTGLTNGATVACTVTATSPGGTSVASNSVLVTPVAVTVPGAPTIGSAIPGNTQATIAFTPPASNGGSAITSYTATCNPGNITGSSGVSPITVSSLVNGTSYTCSVKATNAIGESAASATVNVTPGTALALVGVVSRKTHGATGNFDVVVNAALAITDAITTEPRTIGAGHTLVFQFSGPVSMTGSVAAVDSSALPVGTVSAVASGNDVVVTLTGVPDNKRVTVLLTNVNAAGLDASASVGFLVGDVNGTGSVNSSDISSVKARSGQITTAVNFKFDVNATGAINASDISAVKARSGLVLAP